ncbi:MAG: class I SAM-dependent methyltransferase [Bacillota bacterium]
METRELIESLILEEKLSKAILSNRRSKELSQPSKITISPVTIKGELVYQFESIIENKAIHENLEKEEAVDRLLELIQNDFRQGVLKSSIGEYQILTSKKGKQKIIKNDANITKVHAGHNRKKQYIINEGEPVDFLIHLGVMDSKGKVYKQKYNKFRQINKFLELVDASIHTLLDQEEIRIIDFGCGKSYLTFALHHYLVKIKNKKTKITGLDLKQDVIDLCNRTTEELNYDGLKFICGDIKDHTSSEDIDMVVTLHACDTATDVALEKAVRWGAKVILSVPCCQHELYDKIKNDELSAMLKHGIIRERLSSLVTDSIRGSVLEILGYQVQLLEFIDMEHTPKNIMIRAIKKHPPFRKEKVEEHKNLKRTWGLEDIFIENAMKDLLENK